MIKLVKENKNHKKYKLVFDSASRLSRDSKSGCALYEDLFNSNVELEFLKEPQINTSTFRQALNNQIKLQVKTGNEATDQLISAVITALNDYTIKLSKEMIKKIFDQSQKELDDLHQRTREGMLTAKLNGKQIGLQKGTKLVTKKSIKAKEQILKYNKEFNGTLSDSECIKLIGIAKNTYFNYKKELKAG